ncbi:serine hydrolase [Streptomyces sp. NPDC060322]|uniref:serine hydrolase n=1 Tax=Streptomyces sp. NPDC060322 TaxID=3347097 RepID=UPI003651D7E5
MARLPVAVRGSYAYSHTTYALLGLVVRRVTGHPYATESRRRVLELLRLTGTSPPGHPCPSSHSRGYHRSPDDGTVRDVTAVDPRFAGEVVSTTGGREVDDFYAVLSGGRLPTPAEQATLLDTRPRAARTAWGSVRRNSPAHHRPGPERAHHRQSRPDRRAPRRTARPHLPGQHGHTARRGPRNGAAGRGVPPAGPLRGAVRPRST